MKQENEKFISGEETQPEEPMTPGGNSRALPFIPIIRPDDPIDPGDPEDPDEPEETAIIGGDFVQKSADFKESLGAKSTIELNLSRGKMFFTQHLFAAEGNHLPVDFSITHNRRFSNTTSVHGQQTPFKGWKLNYQQFIRFADNKCVYVDGAFKEHIFEKAANNTNIYFDVSTKSGAILKSVTGGYELFDGANTTLLFQNYKLVKITQKKGTTSFITTISYNSEGQLCQITDGKNNSYLVNYYNNVITITNADGTPLTTLTPDNNSHLDNVTYYEEENPSSGKACIFTYDNTTKYLTAVHDELSHEKMSFDYSTYGQLTSLKKYVCRNNVDTPLQSAFLSYYTNYTILSQNNGTDVNMSQIRYKYTFNTNGSIHNVCEIDATGNPIGKQTYISYEDGVERQITPGEKRTITLLDADTLNPTPPGTMYPDPYEVFNDNFSIPTEYQDGAELKISWNLYYEDEWADDEEQMIAVDCYLNDTLVGTCEHAVTDSFPLTDSCMATNIQVTNEMNLKLKVRLPFTGYSAFISNIQVEYSTFTKTEKQLYIKFTPDYDIIFANPVYVTENIDGTDQYWFPANDLQFIVGTQIITPVMFTFEDFQKTLISYIKNPSNFNLFYDDGETVLSNISSLAISKEFQEIDLDQVTIALITSTKDRKMLTCWRVEGSVIKISQREIGSPDENNYTKLDMYLRTVEKFQDGIKESYVYDTYGNLIDTYIGENISGVKNSASYFQTGQLLESTTNYLNQAAAQTLYTYDSSGLLTSIRSPSQQSISFGYKDLNKLNSISATVNDVCNANSIVYEGSLVASVSHNNTQFTFDYDARNNISCVTVADKVLLDKEIIYDSDKSGKYTVRMVYDDNTIVSKYDKYQRLVQLLSEESGTTKLLATYIYADAAVSNSAVNPNYSATSVSMLRKVIDSCAQLVYNYTYNIDDVCIKTEVIKNSQQQLIKMLDLDEQGNPTGDTTLKIGGTTIKRHRTYSSSQLQTEQVTIDTHKLTTAYSRNIAGNLTAIEKTTDGVTIKQSLIYQARTQNGTTCLTNYPSMFRTSIICDCSELLLNTASIKYDINGNIIKYGPATYEYDGLNRLVRENNLALGRTFTWQYDAGGNITSRKEYAYSTDGLVGLASENAYIYDSTWKDLLKSFNGQAITYDNAGNPLTYGSKTFNWTRGKLLSSVSDGDKLIEFTYDASGRRIGKATDTATYKYLYDNDLVQIAITRNGTTSNLTFVYDSQGVAGFTYGGKFYRYVRNLFGDVTDIYQANDCVVHYAYDAWGNHTVYSPMSDEYLTDEGFIGNINPIRYRGYFYDVETGLYYCNNRYYSPEWNRFVNASSTSSLDSTKINGLNLYRYECNNPIGRVNLHIEMKNSVPMVDDNGKNIYVDSFFGLLNSQHSSIELLKDLFLNIGEAFGRVIWGFTKTGKDFLDYYRIFDGVDGFTVLNKLSSPSAKFFNRLGFALMALDIVSAGFDSYFAGHSFEQGFVNVGLTIVKNIIAYKISIAVTNAVGLWIGTKLGATLGSWAGPIGMLIGAVAGAIVGYFIDTWGDAIIDWFVGIFD